MTNLELNEEKLIIKQVCSFYNIIESAAKNYEPHRISNYLYDLAKPFIIIGVLETLMKVKEF